MKKNLMKKVFAVTLSVAMACSIIPATNPVTASAASSVKLNTKFKTLKIGAKYKLTLAKNTKNWKVVKATSKAPAIAKVYKTTSKAVKVKGKSEGRTNVIVKLKSGKKTTKLKCKFNVVEKSTPSSVTPDPGTTEVKTDAEVKNQAELDEALNDSNIKKITIKTDAEEKFTTPEKSYDDVDLIVNAPKSDVENNAKFKSIEIKAIADETWTENAVGNSLRLAAAVARIVVGPKAVVNNITLTTPNAQIKLEVKGGEVGNVKISAKITLDITGEAAKPIPVEVDASAKDTEVTSGIPVEVETKADMKMNLTEGSAGSTLKFAAADVNVDLKNGSGENVAITKFDGTTDTARPGFDGQVTSPSTTTTPVVTPGTTTPTVAVGTAVNPYSLPDLNNVIIETGASIYATTGSASVISNGSLTFRVSGVAKQVSGAAIECRAEVDFGSRASLGWQECNPGTGTTFLVSPIYKVSGSITIKLYFRVKATSAYKAGTEKLAGIFTIRPNMVAFGDNETSVELNTTDQIGVGGTGDAFKPSSTQN